MKKIVTVIGARPQFIKASIVSRHIQQMDQLKEVIVHTGQHYDANMSDIFFDELETLVIDYTLGIGSSTQGQQTGSMIAAIEKILLDEMPSCLLIYGDTNSTLAGALAAAKLHIPIAHVEAGLRSYNRKMPEEINRIIADQLSDVLFTPTTRAVKNLEIEGFAHTKIKPVGDVMFDAALYYAEKSEKYSRILNTLKYKNKEYILATIHRAENTNDLNKLKIIFTALHQVSQVYPVIFPIHPRTRKILAEHFPHFLKDSVIHFIDPVGYLDMIQLEKNAFLIITDSGGIQKEAFFYQVPCVTLRSETEWIETVELHWNTLVDPINSDEIYQHILQSFDKKGEANQLPYGQGNASHLIAAHLKEGMQ